MNWLLTFLLAYLLPGVDDLDVEPPADDEPPADEEPADDEPPADDDAPEGDDDPDAEPSDEPAPRETRAKAWQATLRERAQKAERDLATARAELEAARRPQQQQPQTPTQEQVLWQQEEETLRNPEASDWQKYAISANRAARQATSRADQALAQAQDMADRTAFQAIASDKPKTFAAYKDKVEAKVQELRARGQYVPREAVLKMMLGEDMLAGKLRTSEKVKPKAPAARRAPASDVIPGSSGGRLSDSERRAKRLENIRI